VILRFVSPALKNVVYPILSRSGYFHRTSRNGPAVLTYHGIFPQGYKRRNPALDGNLTTAESFRAQLQLIKRRYHVISPQEFLDWIEGHAALPPRSVLLTCDDALQNNLTEMLPILREQNLSCLFFATAASVETSPSMLWYEELYLMLLDTPKSIDLNLTEADIRAEGVSQNNVHSCWWRLVEKLSAFDGSARRGFLDEIREQLGIAKSWKERIFENPATAARFLMLDLHGLRQLATSGMTIGAHSLSHPILAKTPLNIADQEIFESRNVLQQALDAPIWAFGFPFGTNPTVGERERQLAQQAGYRCAFMNIGGGFGATIQAFAVPRVHVTADMELSEFEAHLSGFYLALQEKLRRAG
jgi:peptidoglycan/xylan/chitin deacetylase (PgdA/CDA1 family)